MTCVELGAALADEARANLARFPNAEVINQPFERWDGGNGVFDAVVAATAWHWLDPETKYQKARSVLKPVSTPADVSPTAER